MTVIIIINNQLIIDNGTSSDGMAGVEIVELDAVVQVVTGTSTEKTAFVVNQLGDGDVADFRAKGVSIVNIADTGLVSVVGEMSVDGRLMVCSGAGCGTALDEAVDETMGDMGVEGTVVAGAFASYCEDGYIWVPGSAKYGTMPGFCIEAEEYGQVNVSQGEAQLMCLAEGDGYHLITENEWMTIAENILRTPENDVDEYKEGLQLATVQDFDLSSSSEEDMAINEFVLSTGENIYNLIGGVSEWTDFTLPSAGLIEPRHDTWQEYFAITDYKGLNINPPYYYSSDMGIGRIKTGTATSSLHGFVRGESALFDLDLTYSPIEATSTIGFRCAK